MNGRLAAVAVVLLVILAGCTGGGGGDGASTPTVTPTVGGGGGGGGNGGGGGGNGGGDGGTGAGEWDPYEFRQGEFYEYEFSEGGERLGTVSWEVLSVSGDGRTVSIRAAGEFEGEPFEETVSGPPETVYTGLLGSPAGSYIVLALYSPFVGAFQGEDIAVGGGWSYSNGEDTVSYGIERTDTLAGRDVYVAVIRENGQPVWETWVDPQLSLAAKTVVYDEGVVDLEVSLTEYRN